MPCRDGTGPLRGKIGRGQMRGINSMGECICPKCGYKQKHDRGIPCSTIKCPNCNNQMIRE
jgi:predicted Zn-ribbon and HTH transcriptional regulator